jgi:outer membrane lipoprotein SlyB
MRNLLLAVAATAVAIPATFVAPTTTGTAEAAQRRDGYYNGRVWRDRQGRYRCRRSNGTTGLLIGGAAGALAGRAIDTRGERTTGTVVGAVAGALVGREIQRSNSRRRCR